MDLRQLRYFIKVVELRNITAAAEALFIAQPSLSQHMANLEAELEVALLERSVHGTRPTDMGELLYHHAKTILRQFEDTRLAMRRRTESPAGRVAIGLPTSTSRSLAAPFLEQLQKQYPLIELELVEASSGDLVDQVAMGRLALAITMDTRADPRLQIKPVLEEELFVVTQADRRGKSIGLRALAALPLLLPTYPNSVRAAVDRVLHPLGLRYRLVAQTSAVEILLLAIERGLGATILPTAAFTLAQHQGRVRGVPIVGRPLTRELSLSMSVSASRSPAVQCVRALLLRIVQEEVHQGRWVGVRLLMDGRQRRPARAKASPERQEPPVGRKPRSGAGRLRRTGPPPPAD